MVSLPSAETLKKLLDYVLASPARYSSELAEGLEDPDEEKRQQALNSVLLTSSLFVSCSSIDLEIFKLALECGASLEVRDRFGTTPAFLVLDNYECLKTLLDYGQDPNAKDPLGRSLVHLTVRNGNARCLRLLLDADAETPS